MDQHELLMHRAVDMAIAAIASNQLNIREPEEIKRAILSFIKILYEAEFDSIEPFIINERVD